MSRIAQIADEQLREHGRSSASMDWRKGFAVGAGLVIGKLKAARRKMVETYAKGLDNTSDKEAYRAATAAMALEVDMILSEFLEDEV